MGSDRVTPPQAKAAAAGPFAARIRRFRSKSASPAVWPLPRFGAERPDLGFQCLDQAPADGRTDRRQCARCSRRGL